MAKINKCIELLAAGQPIYATHPSRLTYEAGLADAKTWADMLLIDFEHHPFDTVGLTNFMRGLKDGGPTASGHPTPTVVCTLPSNAITARRSVVQRMAGASRLGRGRAWHSAHPRAHG